MDELRRQGRQDVSSADLGRVAGDERTLGLTPVDDDLAAGRAPSRNRTRRCSRHPRCTRRRGAPAPRRPRPQRPSLASRPSSVTSPGPTGDVWASPTRRRRIADAVAPHSSRGHARSRTASANGCRDGVAGGSVPVTVLLLERSEKGIRGAVPGSRAGEGALAAPGDGAGVLLTPRGGAGGAEHEDLPDAEDPCGPAVTGAERAPRPRRPARPRDPLTCTLRPRCRTTAPPAARTLRTQSVVGPYGSMTSSSPPASVTPTGVS